jgi:hypothetical protein
VRQHPSPPELTREEQQIIARLRDGPQPLDALAKALQTTPEHITCLLESLDRAVGIVPLYRFGTLRYGLAE